MDKYIAQLVQDINTIISQLPEPPSDIWNTVDVNSEAEVEDISYIEQHINGSGQRLEEVVGIRKEELPREEKLTDHQLDKLLASLERLLEYYHYEPAYPAEDLTARTKYKLLYNIWNSEQPQVTFGVVGIEFCYFDKEDCPVPGECEACQRFEEEMEHDRLIEEEYRATHKDVDLDFDILPDTLLAYDKDRQEKIREGIRDFKPNKENIPGIFNYCDHWCDRCSFTDQCSNYQMEKELELDKDGDEGNMDSLGIILSETGKMIVNDLEKLGVDVEALISEAMEEPIDPLLGDEKGLIELANIYMDKVKNWFDENQDFLSSLAANLYNTSQPAYKAFNYHLETINWYMTMIPVKANRALAMDEDTNPYDEFEFYDRNATGRLLLDCIQKSMEAFAFLMEKLKDREDELLELLSLLARLKKGINEELPDAATFKRPGLDEE